MKSAPARAVRPPAAREPDRPVLFVDGHCVLCQGLARWVAHRDRRGRLALSTLQGETAGRLLPAMLRSPTSPDTVVLRTVDGNLYVRSAAAIRALSALGGWYRAAVLLFLVPRKPAGQRLRRRSPPPAPMVGGNRAMRARRAPGPDARAQVTSMGIDAVV